jgi:hypothetical protein
MLKPPPASDTTAQLLPAGNESLIISSGATGNSVRVIRGELKKNEDGEDIMDGTKRYRYIGVCYAQNPILCTKIDIHSSFES